MDGDGAPQYEKGASSERAQKAVSEFRRTPESRVRMKSALPLVLIALTGGCGGKTLNVGGYDPSRSSPDGSTPATGLDAGGWPVALQQNARSLRNDGSFLYWIADESGFGEVRRCEKSACAGTMSTLMKIPASSALSSIEIRGDTIYAVDTLRILSCPVDGCTTPHVVVTNVNVAAVAFDDFNVYWSQRLFDAGSPHQKETIYACPLTGCTQGTPVHSADASELAVDATSLYWIAGDVDYQRRPIAVMSAPKDGSAPPRLLAPRQNLAVSLVLRDGFVYWATSFTLGTVARCAIAGCPSDGPELLVDHQYFPHFVNPADDFLFWMSGAPASQPPERPVQILGCQLPSCASTTQSFDEGLGGAYGVRIAVNVNVRGAAPSLPPSEMVVDSEAIYWIGDVVNAPSSPAQKLAVNAAIRRTERRR
jgi:hypothetical protein